MRHRAAWAVFACVAALLAPPSTALAVPADCLGHHATHIGTDGDDVMQGTDGTDVFVGGRGNDRIVGAGAQDWICGGAGRDVIFGGAGNDVVDAGSGHDEVWGQDGTDVMWGSGGRDELSGGAGDDTLFGDAGTMPDHVCLPSGADDLPIGLSTGYAGRPGSDRLQGGRGCSRLVGGHEHDFLLGLGWTFAFGGLGNDSLEARGEPRVFLSGGPGDDTIRHGHGFSIQSGGPGRDIMIGGGGPDAQDGGEDGDSILGGRGGDFIFGGEGHDLVQAQEGIDTVWAGVDDTLLGGSGPDELDCSFIDEGVRIELPHGPRDGQTLPFSFSEFEWVRGTRFDDVLIGDGDANYIEGRGGSDTLLGGGGVDMALYSEASRPVTVDLAAGVGSGAGADTLFEFESVMGSGHDDNLAGDGGPNLLVGQGGSDTLDGRAGDDIFFAEGVARREPDPVTGEVVIDQIGPAGDDTIVGGTGDRDVIDYSVAFNSVSVDLGAGTASGPASGFFPGQGNDAISGVEWAIGSAFDDALRGDGLANVLIGGGGGDEIEGLAGDDFLSGGDGDDDIDGGDGLDECIGQYSGPYVSCEGGARPPLHPLSEVRLDWERLRHH